MATEKYKFLEEFGKDYGYPGAPKSIDEIRASEFKRLDGLVYLDHAGATLYSELQMEAIFKDLSMFVYGNPHSQSNSSSFTDDIVNDARLKILDYCNASPGDHRCIFTSGATGAFKLVGEAFPWSRKSCFMYTVENHNSVLGIREYAFSHGAAAFAIDVEEVKCPPQEFGSSSSYFKVSEHPVQRRNSGSFVEEKSIGKGYSLFAFPSECNFSGVRFNLDMVNTIKENSGKFLEGSAYSNGPWMVLVDAAKGCSTDPPDLSKHPADFVVVSFYKLFGYPTGLGALIVRNEAAKLLKKTYFGGGTVAASIADIDHIKRRDGIEESFEYGTVSFLGIASIAHGLKILNTLTKSAIFRHTTVLAEYVRKRLLALRHGNGTEFCTLYGKFNQQGFLHEVGPTVTFNLRRPDGSWFGYREVEKLASLSGIQLRTGCFCNPGACAKYLGLSHSDLFSNIEAGHVCWDDHDIVHGKPTGAVRISFGYMSTFEDAKRFIDFVNTYFVSSPNLDETLHRHRGNSSSFSIEGTERRCSISCIFVNSIMIYPIKSCAGFCAESWPLCSTGLQHDREWLLKSLAGEILTQKKVPEMGLISTSIDLNLGMLSVESPHCHGKLQIELRCDVSCGERGEVDIHGQRYEVRGGDIEVNAWFSNAIGKPCVLLRCLKSGKTGLCRNGDTTLNFANEAQLLLVSEESVTDLNMRVRSNTGNGSAEVSSMRFRPNLLVRGGEPYAEDEWRRVKMGGNCFACLGGCNRCEMINLEQRGGEVVKSREPLATLASYRRRRGKILFGILLRHENGREEWKGTDSWIRIGQEVVPYAD